MEELEELEYIGLAVAFSHENTIAVGTSKTLRCFYPEFVEYVHAVVIAGTIVQKALNQLHIIIIFLYSQLIHQKFQGFLMNHQEPKKMTLLLFPSPHNHLCKRITLPLPLILSPQECQKRGTE